MKRLIACTLAALALMASVSAQAALIGDFASGDWTKYLTGDVTVNSGTSITLSDEVEYAANATEQQKIAFDYDPADVFGYCVNDDCTDVSGQPGHAEVPLHPGDEFKFSNAGSPTTVSNLRSIPEPATPALLGAGLLLGLALFGRRKSN